MNNPTPSWPPRLAREFRTVRAMVVIYCRGRHAGPQELCVDCQALLDYARARLERCRFKDNKPTCVQCPVHCYLPQQRAKMKEVMKYAGPRMLWHHPLLVWLHWWDGLRHQEQLKL